MTDSGPRAPGRGLGENHLGSRGSHVTAYRQQQESPSRQQQTTSIHNITAPLLSASALPIATGVITTPPVLGRGFLPVSNLPRPSPPGFGQPDPVLSQQLRMASNPLVQQIHTPTFLSSAFPHQPTTWPQGQLPPPIPQPSRWTDARDIAVHDAMAGPVVGFGRGGRFIALQNQVRPGGGSLRCSPCVC